MRKLLIAMALLACSGLTGCDLWNKPAPPPATVTCNCAPPIRGSETAAPAREDREDAETRIVRHRTSGRAHGYGYRAHGYRWSERYAERAVETYGYSSSSRGYSEGYGHGYAGDGCCEDGRRSGGGFSRSTRVWADGYGRRHIYDRSAVAHYRYDADQRRAETPARLDPWHGYDEDWDY